MIDDIRLAYTALRTRGAADADGIQVLAIPSAHCAYVGIDDQRRQHLLLPTDSDVTSPLGVTTISVTSKTLVLDGRNTRVLDVTCLLEALAEVFDHFVAAVVERVSTVGDQPNEAVENVLRRWREFLVAPKGPPGRDKLVATLGELLVVLDTVRTSGIPDIGFWVGPFGGRHDMRTGAMALEVKTTRSHTGYRVTIHGEDQLLEPENGSLYVHFVRLEEVHGGNLSVPSLVDDLLEAGVPAEKLFDALTAGGIPVADLAAVDHITFVVRERLTLQVDDRMPRIVDSSFAGGKRPPGVIDISYVLDLTQQLEYALDADAYSALVLALTAVAG